MMLLLRACRREVVKLAHHSPWRNETTEHVVEPWQVWLHHGVLYLRGYSRTRKDIRTFGLANIQRLEVLPNARPGVEVPPDVWGAEDPRYGVDEHEPGDAVLRFRGPLARWLASARWHPLQQDRWLNEDVLERRLSYRSSRELARKLASVAEGLEGVEPPQLRDELNSLLQRGQAAIARAGEAQPPSRD